MIICYNQVHTIERCIDSVLDQECDFDVKIVIGDDKSTDGTAQIVERYGKKHPQVTAITREHNLGPGGNYYDLVEFVTSPYIASLEGDDYWIHKKKLNFQIRELERRKDAALCFTEHAQERNGSVYHYYPFRSKRLFTVRDVMFRDPPHTSTNVIRTKVLKSLPEAAKNVKLTDTAIHAWAALHGFLIKLGFVGSVWTSSVDGIWNGMTREDQNAAMLECYNCLATLSDEDWFQQDLNDAREFYECLQTIKKLKVNGDHLQKVDLIHRALTLYPEDFNARLSLIRIYISLNELEKADAEIAYLRKFEDDYPGILLMEALLARKRGDLELCKNIIENCRRQFPKYFQASNVLFNILIGENKIDEAEQLIETDKWISELFKKKHRARILIKKGKYRDALANLDQIPKTSINDINYFYAVCEHRLGDKNKALAYLDALFNILPNHKAGHTLLKKVNAN